jgi:hypothetical protein
MLYQLLPSASSAETCEDHDSELGEGRREEAWSTQRQQEQERRQEQEEFMT